MTEKVTVVLKQTDEATNNSLSIVDSTWFGFSNEEANEFSMALAGAIMQVADRFKEAKKSRTNPNQRTR